MGSLLFTGLLINRETVTPVLQWLHTISFFHAAFEALAVNELRYLQLKEIRVGSFYVWSSASANGRLTSTVSNWMYPLLRFCQYSVSVHRYIVLDFLMDLSLCGV